MPRKETPLGVEDTALLRFAGDLRRLRDRAGRPPYRELGRRANYSAAALSDAAGGRRLPSLAVTLAYVRACGGDVREWDARWHALAAEEVAGPEDDGTPYAGLAPFGVEDAERFFGRERLTASILALLREKRFVGVFGASGSGKSSVLRAGVAARSRYPVLVVTPTADPVVECAIAVADRAGTSPVEVKTDLLADPANLGLWLRRALGAEEHLLVVDQFEEAFTLCAEDRRVWLVAALVAAAGSAAGRTRVVIGVRADFLGHCGRHPGLVAALEYAQVLVGPMTPEELRRAITEPAARAGATVETALITRLVADVAGEAAALPLVSHALAETWRHRRGMTVTLAGYEQAGGVTHAIARTAEAVYAGLTDAGRVEARRLFLRLVAPGEGTEDTKRRAPRRELEASDELLERLAAARLVVLDRDSAELSHEALIRSWPRLRDWVEHDRDALRTHRGLAEATDTWEREGRDADALYRGLRLEQALDLPDLTARERDFLAAGAAAEDERRASTLRRDRSLRRLVALLVAVAVVLAATVVVAVSALRTATRERNEALSLRAAEGALAQAQAGSPSAVWYALAAYRVAPTAEAADALRVVAAMRDSKTAFLGSLDGGERVVAVGPSGRTVVTMGVEGTYRLWGLGPGRVWRLAVPWSTAPPLFSPGETYVVVVRAGRSELWRLPVPGQVLVLAPGALAQDVTDGGLVAGLVRDPDAGGASIGSAALWSPAGGATPVVALPGGTARSVAVRRDGRALAVLRRETRTLRLDVELWAVDGRAHLASVAMSLFSDVRAEFAPDGRRLVLADVAVDRVFLLDTADPTSPGASVDLDDLTGAVDLIRFGATGDRLVVGRPGRFDLMAITPERGLRAEVSLRKVPTTLGGAGYREADRELVMVDGADGLWRFDLDERRLIGELCAEPQAREVAAKWSTLFPDLPERELCPDADVPT
ncbi:helix-turn-helix transcriptional regulator [Actinosynnema sp. NPDC020468]|uniref:helix-turn-helix transcriptional regulator n=1 Tax=Actinosynnema sp. NPDC020468 TaxID=3154488 RepID=UPI0034072DAE